MSLPESMSRIVIVGTKSHMDEAIDALYSVKAIHLIDHTVDADEGFSLGTPRPYSPKASERLLKVRAMEKELGITKHVKADSVPEDEIKSQISSDSVEIVEKEVLSVLDKRNDLNQRITELNATKKNLELLSDIPVDLELYSGYRSIFGVVGTVAEEDALLGYSFDLRQTLLYLALQRVRVAVERSVVWILVCVKKDVCYVSAVFVARTAVWCQRPYIRSCQFL